MKPVAPAHALSEVIYFRFLCETAAHQLYIAWEKEWVGLNLLDVHVCEGVGAGEEWVAM